MPYGRTVPWYACIAIVVVVWGVSQVRSPALKAFIYSFPIPMTLVMVSTDAEVSASYLIGVVSLVLFFFVIAGLRQRLGWHSLAAVAGGVAFYLLVAFAVAALPTPHFVPTLIFVVIAWLGVVAFTVRRGLPVRIPQEDPAQRTVGGELVKISALTVATFLLAFFARTLGGFAVTFPYSGILVSFGLGNDGPAFARSFAFSSISLVAFFTTHWLVQDALTTPLELLVSWLAFFASSGLVALLRSRVALAQHTAG